MEIQENITLKDYTTFAIGGPAKYFVEAQTSSDVVAAIAFAEQKNCPYYVIGGGSNILFSDRGFDGVIIRIGFSELSFSGHRVTVGAGYTLLSFLRACADYGLSGLENMAGIPGSVGGAVRGNAGAFGTEIKDALTSVRVLNVLTGQVADFTCGRCAFGYRDSYFKSRSNLVIAEAVFDLEKSISIEVHAKMDVIIQKREQKHIQDIKSAGSFFMNPVVSEELQQEFLHDCNRVSKEGRVPAGWLLERAGINQKKIGGIQAGEMHANYFINTGDGTAEQAVQLASLAKTRVRDSYGVKLSEEVQLVGF